MNWEFEGRCDEVCLAVFKVDEAVGGLPNVSNEFPVRVADLHDRVVAFAVPASHKDGAGCVLGLFGRAFDEVFPQFPTCNDVEALLDDIGMRLSRQAIKSIVVANDDGQIEEACQLLVEALNVGGNGPGQCAACGNLSRSCQFRQSGGRGGIFNGR
jgi:hypothetical protein